MERDWQLSWAACGLQVPLPPLRFFLRSPEEIRQVYQPPDSSYEPSML